MAALTVADVARELGGRLEGDGSVRIEGLAGLQEARAGDASFLSGGRYASAVAGTGASVIIVGEEWQGTCPCSLIRVSNPDKAFARLATLLGMRTLVQEPGVHATAVIAEGVILGVDVGIGPHCVLEPGVRIGDRTTLGAGCYLGHGTSVGSDTRLYPHVSTREYTRIGDRVIIHNGAVIGSDGFGYQPDNGRWTKIPQLGIVEIGHDVEIGANVTIDRARFGRTVIGDGVKIDNLVQIGHNVKIGAHSALAAQAGVAGSVTVGRGVRVGGQVGISGHLNVGDGSGIGAQAGVTKDVAPGTYVSGYPAMLHDKARKVHAQLMRLPILKQRVEALEKRLADLGCAPAGDSAGDD